ncbi:MAG TPA: acyltransferase family protein [Acidimicrobiales bacterium]|nr:acyltransferase family protein [Acidimicrobiales bacterium]
MAIDTTSIGTAPRSLDPTSTPSHDAARGPDPSAPRPVERTTDRPGDMRYRPALDGLRAIAVLAVLAYHWPASWMPGGFLGVEVFFVISGYLITSLLLGERVRTGTTDLKAFWARRARRLLPALFTLLAVVSAVWLIWYPSEVAGLRGAVVAALAYVTNWYLIAVKQSYFASVGRPSPFLHLWSLAVEEQFYLVWPLVLLGLLRVFRRRMRLVLVAVLAGAAASAALGVALYHPGADPFRVWYGTDTRAAGILLGAALAIAVPPWHMQAAISRGARRLLGVVGLAALAATAWMFVHVNEFDPFVYRGGFVLLDLVTVGLILALVHPATTIVARALAWRPLVWVGRRSYGIYLWHWPIFVLTRPGLDVTMAGWQLLTVRLGGTVVAAELSYRLVEMPIRSGSLTRWLRARQAPRGDEAPSVSIELTRHGPVAVVGERRRRPPSARVALVSVAAVVVVGLIGVGLVRARPGTASAPDGLDLRGVVHDKLGDVIGDGSDTGVPRHDLVQPRTARPGRATPTTLPPIPPIVPIDGNHVIAIGDSVLLGSRGWMRQQFPGVLLNAEVGRQFYVLPDLVGLLEVAKMMRPLVIIDLGTNGPPDPSDLDKVLGMLKGARRVVLVTTREPRSWQDLSNQRIRAAVAGHPNVVIADWHAASAGHPDYFVSDGVHLTERGGQAYVETLAAAIRR